MKEPMVITMAREYASGGSEIAQAVADKLGVPLYNKELITLAAKKSGLTEEAIAASENQRSGSLIYSLYMMGNTMPLADQVYILQSNVIKELAAQGPCVILGRCGDYVLRERENVLRTFVYAPLDARIAFAKSRPDAKLLGLILAIGIVVDDAIVVLENVERHISHGLPPRKATAKAMQEANK